MMLNCWGKFSSGLRIVLMGLDLGPFRLASLTGPYHASVSARFARRTHSRRNRCRPPPRAKPNAGECSGSPTAAAAVRALPERSGAPDGGGGEGAPCPGPRRAVHRRRARRLRLRAGPQGRAPELLPSRAGLPQLPPLPQGTPARFSFACELDRAGGWMRDAVCFVSLHARGRH